MKKFGVVAKKDECSSLIEKKIKEELVKHGWIETKIDPELIICVGGDGTFLHAIHKYMNELDKCCFLAIHTGTLGFFTDYTADEIDACINDILTKTPSVKNKKLLEIEYMDQKYYAVNEMRIENVVRTQLLEVGIDGQYFETFRGTGMCLSTQSGSTAYNRSLNGAVIEEGLELLQLQEITGIHHKKYSSLGVPYIMKNDRIIEFKSDDFNGAILCYDHKNIILEGNQSVKVKLSDKSFKIAEYRNIDYLDRIRILY